MYISEAYLLLLISIESEVVYMKFKIFLRGRNSFRSRVSCSSSSKARTSTITIPVENRVVYSGIIQRVIISPVSFPHHQRPAGPPQHQHGDATANFYIGQQDRKTTENMKLLHTGVEWTDNTPPALRAARYTKHSLSIYPVRYI